MTVLSMWAEPLSEIMYFTNSLNIPRGELLTMKKATKASDNRYYQARFSAAQKNTEFESREAASDVVGIDRTRLTYAVGKAWVSNSVDNNTSYSTFALI